MADELPPERIEIVRLAHSWRIDIVGHHPASGTSRVSRNHCASRDQALRFAEKLASIIGCPVIEVQQ